MGFLPLFFLASLILPSAIYADATVDALAIEAESSPERDTVKPDSLVRPLLEGLERLRLPTRAFEEALRSTSAVVFANLPEKMVAGYTTNNQIWLSYELMDRSTRTLKSVDALSADELATLYHELWHAYLANIAPRRNDGLHARWLFGARKLYQSRGETIHNEAYGLFINEVIARYVFDRRMMAARTPEKRELLRRNANLAANYADTFRQPIFGYYGNPVTGFVSSDVNLPEEDRQIILSRFLDGAIPPSFASAFAEDRF